MEIKVEGLAQIQRKLAELPRKMETKVVRGALREGANVLRDEAKRLVPTDRLLRGTIRTVELSGRQKRFRNGPEVAVTAGDRPRGVFWAHFTEFGTATFYTGRRGRSKRSPYVVKPKTGSVRTVYRIKRNKRGRAIGTEKQVLQTVRMLRIPLGRNRSGPFKFAKQVTIQGSKRRPFMRPALDRKGAEAVEVFAASARRRLGEVTR